MDTKTLVAYLERFPKLKKGVEELLKIASDSDDEIMLADEAEERVIQAGQQMNKLTLQTWAEHRSEKQSQRFREKHPHLHKDTKKN